MMKTLGELGQLLEAICAGDESTPIHSVAALDKATPSDISFLSNPKYQDALLTTQAGAVIVQPAYKDIGTGPRLLHQDPYLCFAKLSAIFTTEERFTPGIDSSAVIAADATLGEGVYIGPNVVIGEAVSIGEGTIIEANTVIAKGCVIGKNCHLYPNVTLYHEVVMGNEVDIHSSSVIGSDGFGFAPTPYEKRKWHKIRQLGSVTVGDRVDIGSSTTIDRGALENTVIGNDVIIDSQVHIGHNCIIGDGTAIAGCVGIAGSSTIGKGCLLAGGVGIAGHLSIVDGVQVTGMTMVTKSIKKPGSYSAGTPMMSTVDWRKAAVRFSQLETLNKRLSALEKQVNGQ